MYAKSSERLLLDLVLVFVGGRKASSANFGRGRGGEDDQHPAANPDRREGSALETCRQRTLRCPVSIDVLV